MSSQYVMKHPPVQRVMALLALTMSLVSVSSLAATCTAANLAAGYCDANGDMVADSPVDKSQWLDPDTLLIADVPNSDMSKRAEQAAPFIRHLERTVGRKVAYFIAEDSADLLAAFKKNRVHIIRLNSGNVERSVRCDGYVPLAILADAEGRPGGYQMELLVPSKSPIKSPREIRGHQVTFVDETSNSGYLTPKTILAKEFGLEAGKAYKFNFSGRQDSSILGAANGIYEIVAAANDMRLKLLRDKMIDPGALRVIYTSQNLPYAPWGVSHRINPELSKRIRDAFVGYDGPMDALEKVNASHSADSKNVWIPKKYRSTDYNVDWKFMRELSAASGMTPKCN